jgi:hypothetical protein
MRGSKGKEKMGRKHRKVWKIRKGRVCAPLVGLVNGEASRGRALSIFIRLSI